ncbi:MAG: hypothetical protein ABJK28_18985 [Algibacter sp.]
MQGKKSYKGYFVFFILLLVYLVFALRYSPIFEHLGSDKEVFQYIGMLIKNKGLPYSDAFDHKPPVIYLINYLGVVLTPNSTWGVFVILNSLGFFSALLIYKLAANELKTVILPILLCISFFCINNSNGLLEEGNLTRQLAAFLTIGILYIVFIGKKTNIKKALIGFLIGIIFFTQQNEILGGLVLCGYYLLFEKGFNIYTFKSILKNSFFFLLGLLIPIVGILLIINHWNNYNDFINQVFLFNFSNYIEDKSFIIKIGAVIYKFAKIVYVNKVLLVISLFIIYNLLSNRKNEKGWNINSKWIVVFVALIFQIASTSISGKTYGHYFLMFIPYVISLFIFSFNSIKSNYVNYASIIMLGVLVFYTVKVLPYQKPDNLMLSVLTKEVASVKGEKGQFYSLNARYLRVNFNLNITSPSRHIYSLYINDDIAKEVIEDLLVNKTKYVLFDNRDVDILPQSLQSFIYLNYKAVITYKAHTLFKKQIIIPNKSLD